VQPGGGGARHLGEGVVHDIGGTGELGGPEVRGLRAVALDLLGRDAAQHGRGVVPGRADDDEVAEAFEEVLHEAPRVLTGLHHPVDGGEGTGGVALAERQHDLVEEGPVGVAEQGDGPFIADGRGLGPGHQLVEQRERVAHGSAAGPDHEGKHAGLDGDALCGAELADVLEHLGGRDQPERIVVGARADGADDLLGLGRREDELDVLGRLFDDLEQGVEALRGHHVGFVEDEDLVAIACGREDRPFPQVAGVVDAVVAGCVDLDHVERSAAASAELDAAVALAARSVGGALCAVEAAGEDARGRGLAAPARAAEEVGVVDPIRAQRGAQRVGHLALTDEFAEGLGTVSAIESGDHVARVDASTDAVAARVPAPSVQCRGGE
jgi:hypothetical protein